MTDEPTHWSSDPYWTEALAAWRRLRDRGVRFVTLDLEALEAVMFRGDGPAYRLLQAMLSVEREEGYDGFKGAPRVLLAAIMRMAEVSGTTEQISTGEAERR